MALIASILSPDNVFLDLDLTSKKRLFEQAGILFENSHGIARSVIFDALFAREKLCSTGLGQGVAIPHGRIKTLKDAVGAFVRLKTPLPFEAPDGRPVNLIFILLLPEQADLHLYIYAELAHLFSDKKLRDALTDAATPEEAYQLIAG